MRSSDRSVSSITSRARSSPSVAPRLVVGRRRAAQGKPAVSPARAARDLACLVEAHADAPLGERQRAGATRHPAADHRHLGASVERAAAAARREAPRANMKLCSRTAILRLAHHLPVEPVRVRDETGNSSSVSAAATAPVEPGRCARSRRRVAPSPTSAAGRPRAARRAAAGAGAGGGSTPIASSTSPAQVTGVAPSRSSAFVPRESCDVISPGTASTSRPSSSARSAVISAPLRSRASTTTVACASPATIRFRAGKRHGAGSTPGGYSETISPRSAICAASCGVRARVVAVDAAAEHSDRRAAALERAAVRRSRRRPREPRDDDDAGGCELARERAGDARRSRAGSCADDRDRGPASSAARRRRARTDLGGGSWIAARRGGNRASSAATQRRPAGCSSLQVGRRRRTTRRKLSKRRERGAFPVGARTHRLRRTSAGRKLVHCGSAPSATR